MDLAVQRLLSFVVVFFHVSLLLSTTECTRILQDHTHHSSGIILIEGDGWELVTDEEEHHDKVPVTLYEVDPSGTLMDVAEFREDDGLAESPTVGGVGENMEIDAIGEMDFAPRSVQASETVPMPTQPLSFPRTRKKAQSPISHSSRLGPLAVGMLVVAAIAVGLMLGAFGGLFFLRLMQDK